MQWTSRIAAQHSALWGFDRWYRLWWYIWPASLALLISGWICVDKPSGVALSGGSWATPVGKVATQSNKTAIPAGGALPWVRPVGKTATPAPRDWSNWPQSERTLCFDQAYPYTALSACTALINSRLVWGRPLAEVLTQRGFLQRETKPDAAIADYDAALKAQPDFAEAFDGRAWIYMTRSGYDAALADLNKAIELLPPSSAGIARYYRGYAFLKLNNYPQALADLNEAQRLQPNNADIYLARGDVEQAQENYDAALRDFDEFSKRAPKDARGPISRGSVLDAMGRSQEALSAFEGAVALEPGNASALAERDRLRAQQSAGNQRNEKPK
jgi:tetratricopeptide (TPR) repeat protein